MIITKTVTIYGFKCEICGHELEPTLPECRCETNCFLEPPNYCVHCGAKLSDDDNQPHNTDNA